MGNLAVWLLGLVTPLVKKALLALGIGFLTYQGIDALVGDIQGNISASFGQLPATIYAYLAMAGVFKAIGIILSGMAARVSMIITSKMAKLS